MPILEPDLSDIDAPIEGGTYKAKIVECDMQTSKSGNPMIVPKFVIQVNDKERTRQAYLVTSGKGAYGFANLLKATGFGDVVAALQRKEPVQFDTELLVGQELHVVVEPDTYNGQPSDKISSFLPQ